MLSFKEHQNLFEQVTKAPKGYRLMEQAFAEKQLKTSDISLVRLFEACFGYDQLRRAREDRSYLISKHVFEAKGAVTTSAFQGISGQIVYNAMLDGYQKEEFVFSKKVQDVPTQFSGEKIAGISEIGDEALVVGEGEQYPLAGVSEDYIETPETQKRGLKVALTREAIFFDRTQQLVERAGQVGYWLGVNKEKRIIDAALDINATRHRYKWRGTSYATFQATTPWVNIKTGNALVDWTDVNASEQLLYNMLDPNTGEPIVIDPKELIVCPELVHTARHILQATTIIGHAGGYAQTGNLSETNSPNSLQAYEIVTSRWLKARMDAASKATTTWYHGDIARAVKYMMNWPLESPQAPANSMDEFDRDIVMQWKGSERGAAAVVQPRALIENDA